MHDNTASPVSAAEAAAPSPAQPALPAESGTSPPSRRRRLGRGLRTGLTLLLAAGFLLRFTLRDRWLATALVFYALSPVVLTLLLTGRALLARISQHRIVSRRWTSAALAAWVWCAFVCWEINSAVGNRPPATIRVAVWNVAHGHLARIQDLAEEIRTWDADVVAVVEAGIASQPRKHAWRAAFPEYDVSFLGGEIICLSRGTSGEGVAKTLPYHGRWRSIDLQLEQGEVTCVIVDVDSDPLRPRGPTLREVAAEAEQLADRPVIVLGDFNTPSDSLHFADLRRRHINAFETAGRGYAPTWPIPLPVLTLDQIWCNRRIRVSQCRLGWSACSDHRPVLAEVTIVAD